MNVRYKYIVLCLGITGLFSCKDLPPKSHGPIKLADPATVITETDPGKLQDMVTDLKPTIPPAVIDTPKPTVATSKPDTTKKTTATPQPLATLPAGPGLKAEFKDLTVFIPGIETKIAGNPNLRNANGAVYTLLSGNLNGNTIHTTGNITKFSQRYTSVIVLKGKNGTLPLQSLDETTTWAPLKGANNNWQLTGLSENELAYAAATSSEIRNAVQQAGRSHHLSQKKIQEWLTVLGNPRAPNQKPLTVTLRSIMWKIDGKDPQGKIFSKQIRVDVAM